MFGRRWHGASFALDRAPTDQIMSSSATPSEREIRILIADDHPIVREGLIAVFALEDDLKVVGHAHDGEEACLLYKQLCPDILILPEPLSVTSRTRFGGSHRRLTLM